MSRAGLSSVTVNATERIGTSNGVAREDLRIIARATPVQPLSEWLAWR